MIDGASLVLALLQKFDPAIKMNCQVEGSPLQSVKTPDRLNGFPNTPTMMFCYYDVVRKWTLNTTQKKAIEEVEGKKRPDRINGRVIIYALYLTSSH